MNLVKKVSLRTAVIEQSTSGGQGYQKCNCAGGTKNVPLIAVHVIKLNYSVILDAMAV